MLWIKFVNRSILKWLHKEHMYHVILEMEFFSSQGAHQYWCCHRPHQHFCLVQENYIYTPAMCIVPKHAFNHRLYRLGYESIQSMVQSTQDYCITVNVK